MCAIKIGDKFLERIGRVVELVEQHEVKELLWDDIDKANRAAELAPKYFGFWYEGVYKNCSEIGVQVVRIN